MATPKTPEPPETDLDKPLTPEEDKPGTNAIQHHPDPKAEPIPGVDHKYKPRAPYVTGND
jgi:hypothetical protein